MEQLYFAKAFDQSPVGMVFLQGGTVLSANPALVSMLKKDLWSVIGAPLDDHLLPEDRPLWRLFFENFQSGSETSDTFESRFVPGDGAEAWWNLHIGNLGLEWSGEPTYFVVLQDVTLRRAAEQKLQEARQLAEGASLAKSAFLANMSHEIRTPLFTITGMTDLLLLGDLTRDQAHHAGQIASAAQHLLDLVNDVLDFSKIEAGQMSLESIPLDLDDVIARCLEVVSLQAYKKGIELILDLDPTTPRRAWGDPSRLRQVLVNLLGNAVKFTHRGRVTLVVEPGLQFRIRDTGIGISEAARSSLFQVFSQADSSTTRHYGGSGLGLAISQKLVAMMGGSIDFVSTLGEGSEFFFSLPLRTDSAPPVAGTPGFRLLVVDDDPGVRDVLERRLGEAGFAVTAVADRASAHRTLGSQSFSAVLIDQELGPEDGWQLASEIRAESRTAGLPLVLMSLLRKTLEPSPRYPADLFWAFVDKPVNTRALVGLLSHDLVGDPANLGPVPDAVLGPRFEGGTSLRIVVAEDHEVNRELFRLLLQSLGHEVVLARDGGEALSTALQAQPHLVFMDLQMPGMNGYEASRKLREGGLKCPIVAVTASALKGELERCQDAGMNGLLTKPFNLETLDAVIRSYSPGRPEVLGDEPLPQDFSWEEALRVFLGNRDLLVRLVDKFLGQTQDLLGSLDSVVAAQDLETLRAAAHALKGSAANLTARALAHAAEALELAASEGRADGTQELLDEVKRAFETFRTSFLHQSSSPE